MLTVLGAEAHVPLTPPAEHLTSLRKKDKVKHGILSRLAPKVVKSPKSHEGWKRFKAKAFRKEVLAFWTLGGG